MSEPGLGASGADIALTGLFKRFDSGAAAVDGVDLVVRPGEFFSLLGPSGCGKTTTLRMIAGFERPDAGTIAIGGRDLTDVPVHRRDIGMVFQSYALLPHRTVAENVAFGLRMRGVARAERDRRVAQALEMVALEGFAARRPAQLSGGQQQRVALARAIVIRPPVLLCDEPLGALDRKLRQQMQVELKALQRSLGVTLVFVTHDQEEALAMSDRIGVMRAGRLEQVGSPAEIYDRPATRFVAGFIGEINLFEGGVRPAAGTGVLALRPERIALVAPGQGVLDGVVADVSFLGDSALLRVDVPGLQAVLVRARNLGSGLPPPGAAVGLHWTAEDGVLLPAG